MNKQLSTSVMVIGGGVGGVSAALALARRGVRCVVSEPTKWVGGQLTAQGVPPDENRWVEGDKGVVSVNASYLAFREGVRDWYRKHRRLTAKAKADPQLNPGGGWVSRLCFEPRVGHTVLTDMLAEHVQSGRITLLLNHELAGAQADGDRVTGVTLLNKDTGDQVVVEAAYVLDATETGDLYPLAGIEHAIGAEHRDTYNEMHGRADHAEPLDQQGITWCFAMERRPGEDHVIDKPQGYDWWRDYTPKMVDGDWPGKLFSWTIEGRETPARTLSMAPWPDHPKPGQLELWRYRRILNNALYSRGTDPNNPISTPGDITLFNCVQMDYFQKPLLGVSEEEKQVALKEAKQQSLCFFYWMQTDAPRHDTDDKTGYPGLVLRGDVMGSEDGFALTPYIREPRRLLARTIITEGDVGYQQRLDAGHPVMEKPQRVCAEPYKDSVGIGHYMIDLHPSCAMRGEVFVAACPFRVPLGALLPARTRNVVAAGKGIGVTHITNGCTRLHPIEWAIGEAAGALAATCISRELEPAQVYESAKLTKDLQSDLAATGVPLTWPWETQL